MGAALYRNGKYAEAIARLKEGTQNRAWDYFFLAMAHHHLGNAEEASTRQAHVENATPPIDAEAARVGPELLVVRGVQGDPIVRWIRGRQHDGVDSIGVPELNGSRERRGGRRQRAIRARHH